MIITDPNHLLMTLTRVFITRGVTSAPDGAKVSTENVIGIEIEDLSEKDREEIEKESQRELEEVMVEKRKKKLAYFQKTRGGVIKKGDTFNASTPVKSPSLLRNSFI
jgi:hypothetical protein